MQESKQAQIQAQKLKQNKPLYSPFWNEYITPEHKKYSVYVINEDTRQKKLIHFGDNRYEHYKDLIGLYSYLDHNDPKRRALYRKRHAKDRINDINTSGYWSYWYLW